MLMRNSSQGELAHRLVKRLYGLTNKKDAPEQIARHYRRAHHFSGSESTDSHQRNESASRYDDTNNTQEFHHTITSSRNNPVDLASFSSRTTRDPAAKVDPTHATTYR